MSRFGRPLDGKMAGECWAFWLGSVRLSQQSYSCYRCSLVGLLVFHFLFKSIRSAARIVCSCIIVLDLRRSKV